MRRLMRSLCLVVSILAVLTFSTVPAFRAHPLLFWGGLLAITAFAICLSLLFHRSLATWPGLLAAAGLTLLALVYLSQRQVVDPSPIRQACRVGVGLLAWSFWIATAVAGIVLLVRKDASVPFLAIAWICFPLLLIGLGWRYGQLNRFQETPVEEQLVWMTPLLWIIGAFCLGPIAFLAHLFILLKQELMEGLAAVRTSPSQPVRPGDRLTAVGANASIATMSGCQKSEDEDADQGRRDHGRQDRGIE